MHTMRRKLISLVLVALMMMVSVLPMQAADYNGLDWAKLTIDSFIKRGIIKADENGNIDPNKLLNRAEMAEVINKAFDFTKTADIDYSDVTKEDSYYKDLQIAKGAGYMKGDAEGTFRPTSPISRQEMAIIIARILELAPNKNGARHYKDYAKIPSEEAKNAIGSMSSSGILEGVGNGLFDPMSSITRAQAYVMVSRAEQVYLELKAGTRAYANTSVAEGKTLGDKDIVRNYNNVTVSGKDAVLTNVVIHGNLTISSSVGDGDVTLDNVTVKGNTYIYGGGANSIKANNSRFSKITMDKKIAGETARLVLSGSSVVVQITVKSGATIEAASTIIIANITIDKDAEKNAAITITASVKEVTVQALVQLILESATKIEVLDVQKTARGASISMDKETVIKQALINVFAEILGTGTIEAVVLNAEGVVLEIVVLAETGAYADNTTSTGGGSSDNSSSSDSSGSSNDSDYWDPGYVPSYPSAQELLISNFNSQLHDSASTALTGYSYSFSGTRFTISTSSGTALYSQIASEYAEYSNSKPITITNISYNSGSALPAGTNNFTVTITFTDGYTTATQTYTVVITKT